MVTWKDISTFSRDDKVREPKSFLYEAKFLRMNVHRHIHYPGSWMLSCYDVSIENYELKDKDLELAKTQAIKLVKMKLQAMLGELP